MVMITNNNNNNNNVFDFYFFSDVPVKKGYYYYHFPSKSASINILKISMPIVCSFVIWQHWKKKCMS